MRASVCLILAACLAAGSVTLYLRQKHEHDNIRRVLEARSEAEATSSRTNHMLLSGADKGTVYFLPTAFAPKLAAIDSRGCPPAFISAWEAYVRAWHDEAMLGTDNLIHTLTGNRREIVPVSDSKTFSAMRDLRQTALHFGVNPDPMEH